MANPVSSYEKKLYSQPARTYTHYPRYDADADNPYYEYKGDAPEKIYQYPHYDSDADNPVYPNFPAVLKKQKSRVYKYPRYNPEDDNPVVYRPRRRNNPSARGNVNGGSKYPRYDAEADNPPPRGMFNTPMFDN